MRPSGETRRTCGTVARCLSVVGLLAAVFVCQVARAQDTSAPAEAAVDKADEVEEIEVVETVDPVAADAGLVCLGRIWPIHAVLMGLASLQLLLGWFFVRRRNAAGFTRHKTLGLASPILALAAFWVALSMLSGRPEPEDEGLHAILGLILIGGLVLMPLLGLALTFLAQARKIVRPLHIWLGRAVLVGLLGEIGLGLRAAGVI